MRRRFGFGFGVVVVVGFGVSWDERPRTHRWLEDYLGVCPRGDREAALVQSVARKWLVSAVARAMQPGCKVGTMLILVLDG
jgi:predicted P-loop ATPase